MCVHDRVVDGGGCTGYKESAMEDAIQAYHDALEKSPTCTPLPTTENLATIHLNCARAHAKLCQMVKSVEMCSQALELQPMYVSGLVQRAMVLAPPLHPLAVYLTL